MKRYAINLGYLEKKGVPGSEAAKILNYILENKSIEKNIVRELNKLLKKGKEITLEKLKSIMGGYKSKETLGEVEEYLSRVTNQNKEKIWLRGLLRDKNKDEQIRGLVRAKGLLDDLHSLPENKRVDISKFKDLDDLDQKLTKLKVSETDGGKLFCSYTQDGNNITVYKITNQKELDNFGKNCGWCCLSNKEKMSFFPFEYYMFYINGEPKVLLHQGSKQLKVCENDGLVQDGNVIKAINPAIEKYNLLKGDSSIDYDTYRKNLSKLSEYEKSDLSKEDILSVLNSSEGIKNASLLSRDKWYDVFGLISNENLLNIEDISKINNSFLYLLFNYYVVHHDKVKIEILEDKVINWFSLDDGNLTIGRYDKKIPKNMKTNKVSKVFIDQRKERIEKERKLFKELIGGLENSFKNLINLNYSYYYKSLLEEFAENSNKYLSESKQDKDSINRLSSVIMNIPMTILIHFTSSFFENNFAYLFNNSDFSNFILSKLGFSTYFNENGSIKDENADSLAEFCRNHISFVMQEDNKDILKRGLIRSSYLNKLNAKYIYDNFYYVFDNKFVEEISDQLNYTVVIEDFDNYFDINKEMLIYDKFYNIYFKNVLRSLNYFVNNLNRFKYFTSKLVLNKNSEMLGKMFNNVIELFGKEKANKIFNELNLSSKIVELMDKELSNNGITYEKEEMLGHFPDFLKEDIDTKMRKDYHFIINPIKYKDELGDKYKIYLDKAIKESISYVFYHYDEYKEVYKDSELYRKVKEAILENIDENYEYGNISNFAKTNKLFKKLYKDKDIIMGILVWVKKNLEKDGYALINDNSFNSIDFFQKLKGYYLQISRKLSYKNILHTDYFQKTLKDILISAIRNGKLRSYTIDSLMSNKPSYYSFLDDDIYIEEFRKRYKDLISECLYFRKTGVRLDLFNLEVGDLRVTFGLEGVKDYIKKELINASLEKLDLFDIMIYNLNNIDIYIDEIFSDEELNNLCYAVLKKKLCMNQRTDKAMLSFSRNGVNFTEIFDKVLHECDKMSVYDRYNEMKDFGYEDFVREYGLNKGSSNMGMIKIAQNLEYLERIGVPGGEAAKILEYLKSIGNKAELKYKIKNLKKNPLISLEELKGMGEFGEKEDLDVEIEGWINSITNIKKEKDWLRELFRIGKIKEEDIIKVKGLLDELHSLPEDRRKDISNFKDDGELFKYLQGMKEEKKEKVGDISDIDGAKLLDSYESEHGRVDLYFITNQEALDKLGGEAFWCCLSERGKHDFEPFEYYMFYIDGKPEVLLHKRTKQIRDFNDDLLSDGRLIMAINPLIKKHNLIDLEDEDEDEDEDGYDDFDEYKKFLNKIKVINEHAGTEDGEEVILNFLKEDMFNFNLIDEKYWDRCFKLIDVNELRSNQYQIINKLNYKLLDKMANYAKIKDNRMFEVLEDSVVDYFYLYLVAYNQQDLKNISYGRINKKIPKILLTEKAKKKHKDASIDLVYAEPWILEEKWFPENLKRDEKVIKRFKDGLMKRFESSLKRNPKLYDSPYFPKELKSEFDLPDVLHNLYLGWYSKLYDEPWLYKEIPEELIKYDNINNENIWGDNLKIMAYKGWKNILKKEPWMYDSDKFPKEFKDEELESDVHYYWSEVLYKDPFIYFSDKFPEKYKGEDKFLDCVKDGLISKIRENPRFYDSDKFPKEFKDELLYYAIDIWFKEIRGDVEIYYNEEIPEYIENDPDLERLLKLGWENKLSEDPLIYFSDKFPEKFRKDKELYYVFENEFCKSLSNIPDLYDKYKDNDKNINLDTDKILKFYILGWKNQIKYNLANRSEEWDEYVFNKIVPDKLKMFSLNDFLNKNCEELFKEYKNYNELHKNSFRNTWTSIFNDNFIYA